MSDISPSERTDAGGQALAERGCLALIDQRGVVIAGASFRVGDPDDLNRAVEFINDGRRRSDQVRRFVHGEPIVLGKLAPRFKFADREGDCDLCDGWHPTGDHGASNLMAPAASVREGDQ